MRKNIVLLLALLSLCLFTYSQKDLKSILWSQVTDCWSMNIGESPDDDTYFDVIDDSANGYLHIAGGWPTMGCNCSNSVGAFTNKDGSYTIINKEYWECDWVNEVQSNRELDKVFPEELNINAFIPNVNYQNKRALFFIDVEVPRVGTDMKVSISPIPFGMNIEGENGLAYGYRESENMENCKYVSSIRNIFTGDYSKEVIEKLLDKKYDELPESIMNNINISIGDEPGFLLKSNDDYVMYMKLVQQTYKYYLKIKYDYIILGWDLENSKFYIKEKHEMEDHYGFTDFVKYASFWSPIG